MATPLIVEPIIQKDAGDCAVAALAMLLSLPYAEVSKVALELTKKPHKKGLYTRDMKRIAHKLGHELISKQAKGVDLDGATGIVLVKFDDAEHALFMFLGVIFDPWNGWLWELDAYLAEKKAHPLTFLTT